MLLCCLLSHCFTSVLLTEDNNSDSSDSGDEEDSEDKEDTNKEDSEVKYGEMATPKKKLPPKAATSTTKAKKIKSSEVDSIAKGIHGISVSTTNLFSFQCVDSVLIREWVPVNKYGIVKDYTEVDINLGQTISETFVSATLSLNGQHINYKKATYKMFGEVDCMKLDKGRNYRPDNPRVLAHDDTCQMIRTSCKAKDGKFWPIDEDMQIIKLPEKCRGVVI